MGMVRKAEISAAPDTFSPPAVPVPLRLGWNAGAAGNLTGMTMNDVSKGPGDIWGGPDDEPAFGLDDAVGSVASGLDDCDTAELVQEVVDCRALLDWVAHNVDIPAEYLPAFRAIDRRSRSLNRAVEARYEEMNAPFQPDDDE